MSSRDSHLNASPLDHSLRQSLLSAVGRCQPGPEVRRRLLKRAAARNAARWSALFALSQPPLPGSAQDWVVLGWRELAFAQAMRPLGLLGSLSLHLR
jgi:hypothetical protein